MPTLSKSDQAAKVSQNESRRRKEYAIARRRELELEEMEGRLIPVDQVIDAWTQILAGTKTAVLRIPDKCAPAVAAVADPRECRGILAAEVELILRTLSDDVRRLYETGRLGRGGHPDAAKAGKSRRVGKRALPTQ